MIDPKELRIGNLVMNNGCVLKVASLSSNEIIVSDPVEGESIDFFPEEVEPIMLSEEWLNKLAFCKQDHHISEPHGSVYEKTVSIVAANKCVVFGFVDRMEIINTYVSYTVNDLWASNNIYTLHQLQNLYYALTGEELTLKNS